MSGCRGVLWCVVWEIRCCEVECRVMRCCGVLKISRGLCSCRCHRSKTRRIRAKVRGRRRSRRLRRRGKGRHPKRAKGCRRAKTRLQKWSESWYRSIWDYVYCAKLRPKRVPFPALKVVPRPPCDLHRVSGRYRGILGKFLAPPDGAIKPFHSVEEIESG